MRSIEAYEQEAPIVPDELQDFTKDEAFQENHEHWQHRNYGRLVSGMPKPVTTEYGQAVILDPLYHPDDTSTMVLALPYQQPWQLSHYIRAAYARELLAPDSRMIVLPNNNLRKTYYQFNARERRTMEGGSLTHFFQNRARLLEALQVKGEVTLTGYSLGGLTVLGIAAQSPDFEVKTINADEAPNYGDVKQQRRHFLQSGGWHEQQAAIADAKLPVLFDAFSTPLMALDYARFGLEATIGKYRNAITKGMAGTDIDHLVDVAKQAYPEVTVKLGYIAGSKVFNPNFSTYESHEYTGRGTHKHATGDNVAAHALMIADAMRATSTQEDESSL